MEKLNNEYYKAYDKRYGQVYKKDMLWSSKSPTSEVIEFIEEFKINKNDKILELGCGEGRDAINLLEQGYNVLALDYSKNVIYKCNELSNNKYINNFKQFDLITDKIDDKFKFIYSIAVLHMFVLDEHRNKFLKFISEHLDKNGKALICILGDGIHEKSSNIDEAFTDVERVVMNNNTKVNIASTSLRIVNWESLEKEITRNNLIVEKKWISNTIPEFNSSMCVIVSNKSL